MQTPWRSCSSVAKALMAWAAAQRGPLRQRLRNPSCIPFWNSASPFCQSQETKDFCLPNWSWSQEMMKQYERFMEMSKDGTWQRLPNSGHFCSDVAEWLRKGPVAKNPEGTRMFLRNMDTEGVGFEYAMFFNRSQKRMVSIFQPGRYLEGGPGLVHGGAVAAMLDNNLVVCAICSADIVMTANLNINFLSPIMLGSVVLVDSKLDRVEGKKVYVSGHVQSADGKTTHAKATALFIQQPVSSFIPGR